MIQRLFQVALGRAKGRRLGSGIFRHRPDLLVSNGVFGHVSVRWLKEAHPLRGNVHRVAPTQAQLGEAGRAYIHVNHYVVIHRSELRPDYRPGGIDVHNIADFFKAGCAAVGLGSSLVSEKILRESDWPELTRRAAEFVKAARQARNARV